MKRLAFLFGILAISAGCKKQPETGPCEEAPPTYVVSLFEVPKDNQASFFTRNYRACKKRNLKRNPNALFNVGVAVLHGLGTQKDASKAFLWFKGAADEGHKGAQSILADMFTYGVGVPRDPAIGHKYLVVSRHPPQ